MLLAFSFFSVQLGLGKALFFLDPWVDCEMYFMTSDIGPMTILSAGALPSMGTMANRSVWSFMALDLGQCHILPVRYAHTDVPMDCRDGG